MRTLVATFVVPVVGVCGIVLPMSRTDFADTGAISLLVLFQYLFWLAITIVVVIPLRAMWRRWDFMRLWVAAVIGAGLGCGSIAAFAFANNFVPAPWHQSMLATDYARPALILGLTGAVAGCVFWLIARSEMRPNNRLEPQRHE